ncbi:hypothetical protein EDC05_000238 [Coemansia umbellata]|uniref:Uncharacterized protein n=1 Tax=Coemansia umbellata TaxID=1424467 RepID=A0ABQ8PVL6_9FUNG|nr:hypothetical protein EDC05_000238 [Coemansia umbellata]
MSSPSSSNNHGWKKEDRLPLPRWEKAADGQPPVNFHSRSMAREQLRKHNEQQQQQQQQNQDKGGGVLADLSMLYGQQRKDMHTAFVPGPLDSISASAYVSGHLTPSDQWVAVGNESSGVISLTSSDNEEEPIDSVIDSNGSGSGKGKDAAYSGYPQNEWSAADHQGIDFQIPIDAQYKRNPLERQSEPLNMAQPASTRISEPSYNDLDEQQAVHLLRESVASLLSSGNSGSAVSSALSGLPPRSASGSWRRDSRNIYNQGGSDVQHRRTRSPSNLSKISEPCYHPSSALRKQFTTDFDHFSDIALSSAATPPHYYQHHYSHNQHKHDRLQIYQATEDQSGRRLATQLPTYEEFKQQRQQQQQQQQQQQSCNVVPSSMRKRANTDDSASADATVPSVEKQRQFALHPLLAEPASGRGMLESSNISPADGRSPFASIRTVSPVIVDGASAFEQYEANIDADADADGVRRAQAEAALERTILCPIKSFGQFGAEYQLHTSWAKYTSYAIVGFGVGTLVGVGMLYFDMAANATPKATRTIPVSSF